MITILTALLIQYAAPASSPPSRREQTYTEQWRSGDDWHSTETDRHGTKYCTMWRSGDDWHTTCE